MSAFRHPHNTKVRPIEEELAEMGLNPDRVLSEIDRNTAMLEEGPTPLDLAGLHEGSDDVPRSLAQYGSTLLDEKKCNDKGNGKKKETDDDEDDDGPEGDEYEGMGEGEGQPGEPVAEAEKWIKGAIKDPGRVREYLGVKEGEKIPAAKLDTAIEKLKAVEDKTDDQKSLLSALVLAKRLKKGVGEGLDEGAGDIFIDEDTITDALYLISEGWELDEAGLGIVRKARGAAARLAKRVRHRAYMKARGAMKLAAKIYRKKFKRKIKRREKMKLRRFGREGLAKLHKMGKRIVQKVTGAKKKEWADTIANLREELGELDQTFGIPEPIEESEEEERDYSPTVEALLNAAETAMYLGEVFDAMGDEAGKVLLKLSDKAVDLSEAIEANESGEPTEEQEKHLNTVLDAVIKALKEHEERGAPSLGDAIGMALVAEGIGTWDELVEYKIPTPAEMQARIAGGKSSKGYATKVPAGKTISPDPTVAGKYLKAVNMAMQQRDTAKAMKAAEAVVKKHKVMDAKGLPVTRVETMTDVLRVMFYLSQITGLKAPAWMYAGKKKPWFVAKGSDDQPGAAAVDAKLAGALKALGAPAGLLKAMGEEFEHVTDFVFSLEEAGMGAHSVVAGLDPDQERIFDTIVLMATNDGQAYKRKDAKGAVKKAATDHKREAASDLAFDLKKVEPYAVKEVARRWAEAY